METCSDSNGGQGALLEDSSIEGTGALLLSFHCLPGTLEEGVQIGF